MLQIKKGACKILQTQFYKNLMNILKYLSDYFLALGRPFILGNLLTFLR